MESPASNRHRIRILLLLSFDDDSVPNTQVVVPPLLVINPPEEHPGSADVGIPAPLYAWNISAQPLVPDSDVVQFVLLGIHTKHPEQDPL